MALPQLTDEQRKAALEKAAAARHARAELRDRIKRGDISLVEVLDSEDPIAARMKVSALIESLPGFGKAKAAKIMSELGISATRRVKGLGARQREQLLEFSQVVGRSAELSFFPGVGCREGRCKRVPSSAPRSDSLATTEGRGQRRGWRQLPLSR